MLLIHVPCIHLLFCTSIFCRQYTCFLCMYFTYICFFVQVFFIVNTHASYACISCTLAFLCKYFLSSIHMLLMHVFHVHLFFCASIFYCQYTCFLCTYFMYSNFCIWIFRIVIWTMITSSWIYFIWKLEVANWIEEDNGVAVLLLFRQSFWMEVTTVNLNNLWKGNLNNALLVISL